MLNASERSAQRVLTAKINELEGSLSVQGFKSVFGGHPGGVSIITAASGESKAALTVTSVCSISAEPPIFVFSLSGLSSTAPIIRSCDTVVAHFLTTDQLELAKLGATSGAERFGDPTSWSTLPTGEPIYPEVPTRIRARVVSLVEVGDSTVVLALALQDGSVIGNEREGERQSPLIYHRRRWHGLSETSTIEK